MDSALVKANFIHLQGASSGDRLETSERRRSDSQDNPRASIFSWDSLLSLVAKLQGKVFGTAQNYPHRSRSRYLRFNDTEFCANFPPLLPSPPPLPPALSSLFSSPLCLFNQRSKWWNTNFQTCATFNGFCRACRES